MNFEAQWEHMARGGKLLSMLGSASYLEGIEPGPTGVKFCDISESFTFQVAFSCFDRGYP